jgi:hypothetical protein
VELNDESDTQGILRQATPSERLYLVDRLVRLIGLIEMLCDTNDGWGMGSLEG